MTRAERIVQAARSQLGAPYNSMHCGPLPPDGDGSGFGCAMLVCWCYNRVLGTHWYGSCWNLYGDAIGRGRQEDGTLSLTGHPVPGDVVLYLASSDGRDTDAAHAALYVGGGRCIGAWGSGKRPHAWGDVRETTVRYQAAGGRRVVYAHSTWLDEKEDEGDEMQAGDVWNYPIGGNATANKDNEPAWQRLSWAHHDTAALYARLTQPYKSPIEGDTSNGDLMTRICYMDARIRAMEPQIAALSEAVRTLAQAKGADPDAIARAVSDAVKAKLETIDLKVTTQ